MAELTTKTLELLVDEALEQIRIQALTVTRTCQTLLPLSISDNPDEVAQGLQIINAKLAIANNQVTSLRESLHIWHKAELGKRKLSQEEQQSIYVRMSASSNALPQAPPSSGTLSS